MDFVFSERFASDKKKPRHSLPDTTEYVSEDSVFNLLANANEIDPSTSKAPLIKKEPSFANLINQTDEFDIDPVEQTDEGKPTSHVPTDWSLKTKLRLLSKSPIPGSRLKCNEEASGITG